MTTRVIDMPTLSDIKTALGITGDFQDATLQLYFNEVMAFLMDAGVAAAYITPGLVARGVADLWQYGGNDGKLSSYFIHRATQLSYKK